MKMSESPIHFTKKAVNKLFELQDEANLPPKAAFSITVEDLTQENELLYAFSYKTRVKKDEMKYESNGFPYILDTETAMYMINARIDYEEDRFTVMLDENLTTPILAEA
jgi:Fe-S cluster assembly iron-binding protein IscA|tara:strand:+ start:184 stop:510 length:327 start_codon:yes stop_codon:yes gene_type:complete